MELQTAKALLDLGKGLVESLQGYFAWRNDRKTRVASFCEKIAECLANIVESTETRQPIEGYCGELSTYMDALMELLEGVISAEGLARFSVILNQATIQRTLIEELTASQERERGISVIREAAGSFRGLANRLRASA
jgi:hypothetical protein